MDFLLCGVSPVSLGEEVVAVCDIAFDVEGLGGWITAADLQVKIIFSMISTSLLSFSWKQDFVVVEWESFCKESQLLVESDSVLQPGL